ncbi:uncharacterized protein LOC128154825 isoform X2 [Harpia harpyja]|uniref:uncharacterized protein LOC128154825 isoform X2 n=1 Tax=Harpia harpyja TaxID=202280 RepID=UPI0022B0D5F3|nr:uncharacterized protein LOC128154825 isoform X2 [Harpia harpyja]
MYFVFEVAPGQDGKAGLYLSSPLRPRCILPSLVRGWISGGAGGPLDPAPPPPTHLQSGGAGIFPLFPRVEIIWENICVLSTGKSRPGCLGGDGDLGTDPAPAKPLAGELPFSHHARCSGAGTRKDITGKREVSGLCSPVLVGGKGFPQTPCPFGAG